MPRWTRICWVAIPLLVAVVSYPFFGCNRPDLSEYHRASDHSNESQDGPVSALIPVNVVDGASVAALMKSSPLPKVKVLAQIAPSSRMLYRCPRRTAKN